MLLTYSWLENGPSKKMDFLLKNGDNPASYVSLPSRIEVVEV